MAPGLDGVDGIPTFVTFRFTGDRFDNVEGIPLEIGAELAAYHHLLVEVTKALYRRSHPNRRRLPRGFVKAIDLRIVNQSPGSLVLDVADLAPARRLPLTDDELEQARQLVESAFASPTDLPGDFPSEALSPLLKFGSTLDDTDRIYLSHPGTSPVTYSRAKRMELISAVRNYEELPFSEVVKVTQVDADRAVATLVILNTNESIPARYQSDEWFDVLKEAMNPSVAADRWLVEGTLRKGLDGRSHSLSDITNATNVEQQMRTYDRALDQLSELATLGFGWLDGGGDPPTSATLDACQQLLAALEQTSLPAPALSPLSSGGIHLEWQTGTRATYIDLENDGGLDLVGRLDGAEPSYHAFESLESLLDFLPALEEAV